MGYICLVMSRSYKKHPSINWVCYFSNKKDKQQANRKLRRSNKQVIQSLSNGRTYLEDGLDGDWWEYPSVVQLDGAKMFKILREVSDTYNFASDGLPHPLAEYEKLTDFTKNNRPKTSIAEARREHNYKFLKQFISK